MDGITSSQSTVLSTNKEDSLNKKGSFNSSGVSTLNTEPTGQVRPARSAGNSDLRARYQRSVGSKPFKCAKPGVVPEWMTKAVTQETALAQATGDHGEYTRNSISLAGVPD